MTAFSLTVTATGNDGFFSRGIVTSSPAGIDCGTTCSSSFSSGTLVTLTARAQGNRIFLGWGGACSGTATTCTLTMDANKAVTATFERR